MFYVLMINNDNNDNNIVSVPPKGKAQAKRLPALCTIGEKRLQQHHRQARFRLAFPL